MARERCFIVGLGASAGGMESFQEFFGHLPPDPGLAFILVQHLHSDRQSRLADLLARSTPMPVIAAEDNLEILPDHIYLSPPNTMTTVRDGRLQLNESPEQRGHRSPIDHFFQSLAEECGEKAACVIFSGTGSDGCLGLIAVKEKGGLTVAQNPQNAAFAALPHNAIRTGLVDIVAEVADMPQAIISFLSQSRRLKKEREAKEAPQSLTERLETVNTELESTVRENMLHLVTDSVPVLISYIDADQTFRYCNAFYEDWFGLTKNQVIGRKLREVVGESAWRTIEPQVKKALAGERVQFTTCLSYRFGPDTCVKIQYEPHLSEDGTVAGFIALVQDQTDRLEREKTMGRLAAIVNSSHEVITGVSLEGVITDWNKGAEELYGYSSGEAVGAHFTLIIPQEMHQEAAALYERISQGEYVAPFETVRCAKDGSTINILLSLSPIRTAQGEILGISTVAHDITERIVAERALAEINEHLETRVAERTEQLRNLTARFLGFEQTERRKFSQFLHDEIQQTLAAAKLLIEQAQMSADHKKTMPPLSESLRLLNEAIAHTRSITIDLSPPLFFDTGISACLNWLERWAQAKHQLQVTVSLRGTDRPISEEAGYLLYRCLRELLFNVYKHAGVKEALLSAVFENDGTLRLAVADRGTGFDPQTLEKQVDEHFGILSLIEQIEAIKGGISIDSGSGSGTRISISLPPATLAPPPPAPSLPDARQQPDLIQNEEQMGNNTGRAAILIVDDQEDLRYTLRLMLEDLSSDYLFLEAERAEQAVEMVRQYQPQLVLMDVSMPGLSGVEATRMIKAEFHRTVVIGLSMHEREDMEKAMREAGAAHYLTKDSASEVILSTIEKCLAAAGSA